MTSITPGTPCPVCGKKHRAGSKPLAACTAKLTKATEAPKPQGREARWTVSTETDARGVKIGREWRAADSRYHVAKIGTSFVVGTTEGKPLGEVMAYGLLSEALDAIEAMEVTEGTEAPTNAVPNNVGMTPNVVAYQNGMHTTEAPANAIPNNVGMRATTEAKAQAQGGTSRTGLMNRNAPLAERVSAYLGASVTEADRLLAQGHDAHYVIGALIGAIKSARIELDVFGGAL